MPIFSCERRKLKILFVHIPKTGGGSVEEFFRMNKFKLDLLHKRPPSYLRCSPQHMHREMLEDLLVLSEFDVIFAIVRNPVDRLLSEYKWSIRHSWAENGIDHFYRLARAAYFENPFVLDNHIRPQNEFLLPETKVFKLEDGLQQAVDSIADILDIKFPIKRVPEQKKNLHAQRLENNPSLGPRYSLVSPSNRTLEMLAKDYSQDFSSLEYNPPSSSSPTR